MALGLALNLHVGGSLVLVGHGEGGCLCFYKYLNFDTEFCVYIWCLRLDVADPQPQKIRHILH